MAREGKLKREHIFKDNNRAFIVKIGMLAVIIFCLVSSSIFAATYTYDSLNRLTKIEYPNGDHVEFTYDANGNRLTAAVTKTTEEPSTEPPVVVGPDLYQDFENDGVYEWMGQGDGVLLTNSQEAAYGGIRSMKVSNRTATWQGPIMNVKNQIAPKQSYRIKAFIRLPQGTPASLMMMTIRRTMPDGSNSYDNINTKTATSGDWTVLEGIYQLNDAASSLYLYVESASTNASFFIDNFSIEAYTPEPAPLVHDFEDGTTQGWYPLGEGVMVTNTQEAASSGSNSLKISNRTATWQGPALDLTSYMKKGLTYTISGKLRLPQGVAASDILLTMNRGDGSGLHYYDNVSASHVTVDGWVAFEGKYTFTGPVASLNIYMESANASASFYLDEFKVERYVVPPPVVKTDFEDETLQGWNAQGDGVILTNVGETANSGLRSLKVSNRTAQWQGPLLNLTGKLLPNTKYKVKAAFRLQQGVPSTDLLMTIHRQSQSGVNDYDNVSATAVTDGEWVYMEGNYEYSGTATTLSLYVESVNGTGGFYVDDFIITKL